MIEVTTDTACMLYLGLALMSILGAWLHSHLKLKKKKVAEFTLSYRTCEFCSLKYLEDPVATFSRCPQCSMINKSL